MLMTEYYSHCPSCGNPLLEENPCGRCGWPGAATLPLAKATESKAEGGNTVHSNYLRQLPGGVCFAHGGYTGMQCSQWPKCSTDLQKPEYLDQKYRDDWHAKLAAMRAEPPQPQPHDHAKDDRKLPIDRPCSACSAGDSEMVIHSHCPLFRVEPSVQEQTELEDAASEIAELFSLSRFAEHKIREIISKHGATPSITSARIEEIADDEETEYLNMAEHQPGERMVFDAIQRGIEQALREAGVRVG